MANSEQIERLQLGADSWNRWRKENPGIEIDLSGAELRRTFASSLDLGGFDFSDANLSHARLTYVTLAGANLHRAKMSEITLQFVDLRAADLSAASLVNATGSVIDFGSANLQRTVLSGAGFVSVRMRRADLTEAYMSEASLSGAEMGDANLSMADLSDADLRGASLRGANLSQANLIRADLSGALLSHANLASAAMSHANMSRAILSSADLKDADLRAANLRGADLEGANLDRSDLRSANMQFAIMNECSADRIKLWETQRADWSIKGIRCGRASWDKDGELLTAYEDGEFERLYADVPCIELFYQGGVSTFELSTLPAMLRHLAMLHEGASIRLKSIEETGGGAKISISVGDADAETTERIKADATRVFQSQLALRDNQIVRLQIEKEYLENWVSERLIHKMLAAGAPQTIFNAPVYNAAFANGDARISIEQNFYDNGETVALLEKMLAHRDELDLAPAEAKRFDEEMQAATAELKKRTPDKSAVARGLGLAGELAKEALKKAAGKLGEQALSADWHSWLMQLQEAAHHLHL